MTSRKGYSPFGLIAKQMLTKRMLQRPPAAAWVLIPPDAKTAFPKEGCFI